MPYVFPFLKLPTLPKHLIILKMTIADVLCLASCSLKTEALVKSAKVPVAKISLRPGGLDIAIRKLPKRSLEVKISRVTIEAFLLKFNTTQTTVKISEVLKARSLPEQPSEFWYTLEIGLSESENLDMVYEIVAYCVKMFKYSNLEIRVDGREFFDKVLWEKYPEWTSQDLILTNLQQELTCQEATFLFDNLPLKSLTVYPPIQASFQYQKPFKMKHLDLQSATWVTFESIYSMACTSLKVFGVPTIAPIKLNKLIKHWKTSQGLKNLDEILISSATTISDDVVEEVLKDTGSFRRKNNDPDHFPSNLHFVRRDNDSKEAAIRVTPYIFEMFMVTGERAILHRYGSIE